MKRSLISMIFVLWVAVSGLPGCATTGAPGGQTSVESSAAQATLPSTIVNLQVSENQATQTIDVEADRPFLYTVYKPSDPFRVVVELANTRIGRFRSRILVDRESIFEIVPSQVESPNPVARIEIGLAAPIDVTPRMAGNHLYLEMARPVPSGTPAPAVASASPPAQPAPSTASAPKAGEPSRPTPADLAPEATARESYPVPSGSLISGQPATEVVDVRMENAEKEVLVRVALNGDGVPTVYNVSDKNRLILEYPGVSTKLSGSIDQVIAPVKAIRAGTYAGNARIVIDFYGETLHDVALENGATVVAVKKEIYMSAAEREALAKSRARAEQAAQGQTGDAAPVVAAPDAGVSGKEVPRITLNFQNHEVVPIYRLLARVGGYNLVVHPEVKGTIPDLYLENVPWDKALDIVLKLAGHGKQVEEDGKILRIAPHEIFAREYEQIAQKKDAFVKAADLVEVTMAINYADSGQIEGAIKQAKLLSARGNITVDKRMNTIIVADTQENVDKIAALIRKMDVPKPQVMIEARVVTVRKDATLELGINWSSTFSMSDRQNNITGSIATNLGTSRSRVNASPNVEIGIGKLFGGNVDLSMQMAALESNGGGKTLSNPKILTMDNEKALIQQGTKQPYQTTSDAGTKTEFVDAVLKLEVTPRITPGGNVQMKINVQNDTIQSAFYGAESPPIDIIHVETQSLVKDGETIVIGGIYVKETTSGTDQIPLLGDIPGVGWLFKNKKDSDNVRELLVFLTPRIVRESYDR